MLGTKRPFQSMKNGKMVKNGFETPVRIACLWLKFILPRKIRNRMKHETFRSVNPCSEHHNSSANIYVRGYQANFWQFWAIFKQKLPFYFMCFSFLYCCYPLYWSPTDFLFYFYLGYFLSKIFLQFLNNSLLCSFAIGVHLNVRSQSSCLVLHCLMFWCVSLIRWLRE